MNLILTHSKIHHTVQRN